MTRKDYEAIARAIKTLRATALDEVIEDSDHWTRLATGQDTEEAEESGRLAGVVDGIDETVGQIANVLAADNPRFDRVRFLAACGIPKVSASALVR